MRSREPGVGHRAVRGGGHGREAGRGFAGLAGVAGTAKVRANTALASFAGAVAGSAAARAAQPRPDAPLTSSAGGPLAGTQVIPGGPRRRSGGRNGPPWRPIAVIAAILLPLSVVGVACGHTMAQPDTARVTRSGVSTTVAGTGALRAITEQNLGFNKGGKITELNVTVGQEVTAGTLLARVDDFSAQAEVKKARAAVDRESAALEALTDSEKVRAAAEDADSAEDVLQAVQKQSDQIDRSNDKAVDNAARASEGAFEQMQAAREAHDADDTRCRKSVGGDSRAKPGEVRQPGGIAGELFVPAPVESAACDRSRTSAAALAEAQQGFAKARADERAAQQKRNTDHAEQAVAISNAKRAHSSAKLDAKDVKNVRPHEIEAQQAEIDDARADLEVAQREVEDTAIYAPVDGKVAAINGTMGEYLSGGSGTTPQSPGSRVSLPDVSSEVGETDTKATRPGLGSFIVLSDVHAFQVVVPFEESDAAKVKRNQRVDLTFDSVPGLVKHGSVVSVSPSGSSIQDVTNYYATIVLNDGGDDRLKDGQTVQANVVVGQVNDALVVPNSALQQGGDSGLVTVLEPDGTQRQVQVQLGARGDENTEVLSGLSEGQMVVVAEA